MNIAVLLSGGVDSSVVVHLLCEQGYRPSLFYIKIGRDDADYMDCSAEEDMEMASAIARRYGLSLEVVDLHREYWDQVAAYAIDKIRRGLTTNPCGEGFRCHGNRALRHYGVEGWKDMARYRCRFRERPDRLSGTDRLSASFQTDVSIGQTDEE